MHSYKPWRISGAGAALGILAGCSGPGPAPASLSKTPEAIEAAVREDLDALRALDVVEVGNLIMHPPAGAYCTNLACAEAAKAHRDVELRTQAERLHEFALSAARAAEGADLSLAPVEEEVSESLASLRALEIVEIGDLIVSIPGADPNCYNLPCPSEIKAKNNENAARRMRLVAIANATEE